MGDAAAAGRIAEVAALLGTDRTLVVHGDRVDELPLDGSGVIHDVVGGGILSFTVDIDGLGLGRAPTSALAGGTAAENAAILESIFGGETGPRRDVVVLNAGAALLRRARRRGSARAFARRARALDAGAPRGVARAPACREGRLGGGLVSRRLGSSSARLLPAAWRTSGRS